MIKSSELPRIGEMYTFIVRELEYDPSINSENVLNTCRAFKAMTREEMYEWYTVYMEAKNKRLQKGLQRR